ncbi:MAG: polyphosphate kinase 1 [Victivallales bacterium]|nr:polyphosphate kinase 1 [Victivallales bacterium]
MSGRPQITLDRRYFINRELSWLEFNSRVLDEAGDPGVPVLERLKFIAIFSNNLDEFFMVRVAGLRQLAESRSRSWDPAGLSAAEQLAAIRNKVLILLRRQYRFLRRSVLAALEPYGVIFRSCRQLDEVRRTQVENIFVRDILPVLTPLAIDPSHPFPLLNNGAIEIAVKLRTYDGHRTVYAVVEVPERLPRFIPLAESGKQLFVLIEDMIMSHLGELFQGCKILDVMPFRITRDMDFSIEEDGVSDLLLYLQKELQQRKNRAPVRLEIPAGGSRALSRWLLERLELSGDFKYNIPGPLHLARCFELCAALAQPELVEEPWPPVGAAPIAEDQSMFEAIDRAGDFALFLPFQSFDPVINLLQQAAVDPDVLAIKQTLYRVSGNSPVVGALQQAAENGKQVTVIVELKARFDEGNNIVWARRLEESGAHVVYGIAGLKIHCKALLVIRKTQGVIKRYCHVATGNYNDKTARLYTDIGMFSNDELLCGDLAALFNVMTGYAAPPSRWERIACAPFDLRQKFLALIDREVRVSGPHAPGRIVAKMNSLVDPEIIEHLYRAADAGVQIDLIVRGICCLRPGVGNRNIRVCSIVDRYLEHSRVFYFYNGGDEEYYLSSADWMPRNLDRRIEIMFPVESPAIRRDLDELLQLQLADRRKGRLLRANGTYSHLPGGRADFSCRSQERSYRYFAEVNPPRETEKMKIFRKNSTGES